MLISYRQLNLNQIEAMETSARETIEHGHLVGDGLAVACGQDLLAEAQWQMENLEAGLQPGYTEFFN